MKNIAIIIIGFLMFGIGIYLFIDNLNKSSKLKSEKVTIFIEDCLKSGRVISQIGTPFLTELRLVCNPK